MSENNGSWSCPYCKKKDEEIAKLDRVVVDKDVAIRRASRLLVKKTIEIQKLKEKNRQYAYG